MTDDTQWVSCDCDECKEKCKQRVCWPTPAEAQAIIDAGLGHRLMHDWWVGGHYDGGDIHLLAPAIVGHENKDAPSWPSGRCTFLTEDDECELHPDLKPIEGRLSLCNDRTPKDLHEKVAMMWNNPEAQSFFDRTWYKRKEER